MPENVSNSIPPGQKKHKTASFKHFRYLLIVLVAVVLFIFIAVPFLGQPFGGYHSTNETFFSAVARNYQTHSLLEPTNHHGNTDFTLPPLLSYFLYLVFDTFGTGERQARILVIVFSCFLIVFTYLFGRELYSPEAGVIAALLIAVTPMFTLVGRNVQTDPVFLCFTICSLWLFFKADRTGSSRIMLLSGIVFGLALFTKQFPVLFLPAILLRTFQGLRAGRNSRKFYLLFLVGPLAIPLPYLLYQIIVNTDQFFKVQESVHLSKFSLPDKITISRLAREIYAGFSLIWTPLFAWGAIWFAVRRNREDLCLLSVIVVLLLFNAFFYHHSYYLMGLIPLLSIAAGAMLWKFFRWKVVPALIIMVPVGIIFCFSLLGANKYNWLYYWQVCSVLKQVDTNATVLKPTGDSSSPILLYYLPTVKIRNLDSIRSDPKTGKLLLTGNNHRVFFITSTRMTDRKGLVVAEHFRVNVMPVAFGIGLTQEPENVNFFRPKSMMFTFTGSPWTFGLHARPEQLISATVILPPYMDVYRVPRPGQKPSYEVRTLEGKTPITFVSR